MFASLLGKNIPSAVPYRSGALPPRRAARPAHDGALLRSTPSPGSGLSEAELDHLIDSWARRSPDPATTTIRGRLFIQHLTITLETHPIYEQILVQARTDHVMPLGSLATFLKTIIAQTALAMEAARTPYIPKPGQDDRLALGVPAFFRELRHNLSGLDDPHHRNLVNQFDLDRLIGIIGDTLKSISQEYVLTRQITETAKMIRSMNDLLARAQLPEEDLYELKLRRDVFLTDLRLYNRLTRTALGLNPQNHNKVKKDTLTVRTMHRSEWSKKQSGSIFSRLLGL